MKDNLPKLTYKQQKFLIKYFQNDNNASDAYRYAYDCLNMSNETINVEASRMLKNPKITLWIEYYRKNIQTYIDEEINYSVDDAFKEFEELQNIALNSFDKNGNRNVNAAIKVIENKCKLKGLLKEQVIDSINITQMPSVCIDGKELNFNVGENINASECSENTSSSA